jgi:putative tryptophan/tyrosine transport system substrate-binding protein
MRRIGLVVVLTLSLFLAPLVGEPQQVGKVPRIGLLVIGPPPGEHSCVLALRRGFRDLGYEEGRTHRFEIRWAEGRPEEMLPRFGAELVALGVDLIVSVTAQGLVQAKQAIATVPVVMAAASFPVERGLIASLNRPGGNITGMATFTEGMFQKRVQLLTETLPGRSRVAVLRLPGDQNDLIVRDLEAAARRFGLKLQVIEVQKAEDFADAFNAAARGSAQAVMTAQGPFFHRYSHLIAELALKHKLPSFSGEPEAADAGILMTHGASIPASCHRAAYFVDRILKGVKPADLPVERPTKFDLEINLKTAKALGLTVPHSVLLRADRVIE